MHEARDLQDELFKIGVDARMVEAAAGSALKPILKIRYVVYMWCTRTCARIETNYSLCEMLGCRGVFSSFARIWY